MRTIKIILTIGILQIFCMNLLTSRLGLFAKDFKDDNGSTTRIDSITTKYKKYLTDKEITFKGTFMDPAYTDVYSIGWDFGDGNFATGTLTTSTDLYANPGRCSPYRTKCYSTISVSNVYAKPGVYTVTFFVKNSKGDLSKDSEEIVVDKNTTK